tara:strand:+ start:127 stop:378 length:252 start_codon:yes stop_codon:yes gene_type:complete
MQKDQTNHSAEKNTEDKVVNIDDIVKELPELLVKHAYTKLKSGEELTASEMKVCLEVCKTYSTDNLNKKPDNILDKVPFDTDG